MWIASLFALSVVVAPAEMPSAPGDVRFAQDDEFGDPPPPPPPAFEDDLGEAPPPPPPPSGWQPSNKDHPNKRGRRPADGGKGAAAADEPDFFEQYFPFALSDDLHPAVDDVLYSFWVANLIPCIPFAQIWLPVALLEPDMPDDYLVHAIIVYASHLAPHALLLAVGMPLLILGAIPYIGWFLILPCGLLCNGLNLVTLLVNVWWLMPVAFANNLSRDLKAEGAGGGAAWLERAREEDLAMAY